jgi:hypothetical protein
LRNAFTSNTLDLVPTNSENQITGTITDAQTGQPLTDVAITIVPYSSAYGKSIPIFSDKNGKFNYPAPPGEKDIIFQKQGYVDYVLNIRDEAPAELKIALEKTNESF